MSSSLIAATLGALGIVSAWALAAWKVRPFRRDTLLDYLKVANELEGSHKEHAQWLRDFVALRVQSTNTEKNRWPTLVYFWPHHQIGLKSPAESNGRHQGTSGGAVSSTTLKSTATQHLAAPAERSDVDRRSALVTPLQITM
ncbi:hypothetical protein [Mycobacteroides abscessus]|uniref:hypothetical protein n=1 Tax=Mycobacteroides abscessus TaxID=36809 RepID=UPI0013F60E3A|nr:hypothetical protein [Mycobacteroides abscessus]